MKAQVHRCVEALDRVCWDRCLPRAKMVAFWSKIQLIASICSFVAALIVIISFSTPYWLISDGRQPNPQFQRLGLWEVCFIKFQHRNYLFDKVFRGCMWIFDEDYRIIVDFLEPSFFIAVQIFFTLGFVLLLLACTFITVIQFCIVTEKEATAMRILALLLFCSAISCTIGVITFGARGDGRDWMPDPDHNYLSWSFGLGVVGTFFEYVAAVLYWVEGKILTKKEMKKRQEVYTMNQTNTKA